MSKLLLLSNLLLWHSYKIQALFEECNHVVKLEAGQQIYINSPYYPSEYPLGSSCRYTVQAPADYELKFKCDIKLNTPPSDTRCQHEALHFNPEGDELLTDSEYFCGNGNFERKSFLNRAVISYISMPPYKRTLLLDAQKAEAEKDNAAIEQLKKDKAKQQLNLTPTSSPTPPTPNKSTNKSITTTRPTPVVVVDDEDDDDSNHEDNLTDEVLHALNDAGVSDALAYMATLLYNDESDASDEHVVTTLQSNNGKPIRPATTTYLDKLPTTYTWHQRGNGTRHKSKISKTSVKRAKIVANIDGGGRFSCLVSVVAPTCECGWSMSLKIAGPSAEAGINEFPSMAGVQTIKYGNIFCGAAIIHQRYLLSAAHCFMTPETNHSSLIQVIVGEHDLTTGMSLLYSSIKRFSDSVSPPAFESLYTRIYNIETILPHEHFSSTTHLHNDIALLRTTIPIVWNRSVGPACLPWRTQSTFGITLLSRRPPYAGQRVDAAGWGTTSFGGAQSKRLLKTTLDVIDVRRCRQLLSSVTPAHTFCTFTPGQDTCQYDSGGALYERSDGRLMAVGIVSYGYACAAQEPSVNTRVASYVKWIRDKTPDARYCVK